jgi:hypothetical protein
MSILISDCSPLFIIVNTILHIDNYMITVEWDLHHSFMTFITLLMSLSNQLHVFTMKTKKDILESILFKKT